MGKKSKEKDKEQPLIQDGIQSITINDSLSLYDEKLKYINVIAKPMATKSQAKKIYKLIKKASKEKGYLHSGLKAVQRRVRFGDRGLCILAGNTTPIDIMVHMPGVCEEKKIPYCYTPSRQDLGVAMGVKRGTVVVLVRPHGSYKELYDEMYKELQEMPVVLDKDVEIPQRNL